jgi:hypothetical protein
MAKPRINLRLSHDVYDRLMDAASPSSVTLGDIVEAALTDYFEAGGTTKSVSLISDQLDRIEELSVDAEHKIAVLVETVGLFARYWLTATPPLPELDQEAAHALGAKRFERFMGQVVEAVASSR